jgi:hypothetical protein
MLSPRRGSSRTFPSFRDLLQRSIPDHQIPPPQQPSFAAYLRECLVTRQYHSIGRAIEWLDWERFRGFAVRNRYSSVSKKVFNRNATSDFKASTDTTDTRKYADLQQLALYPQESVGTQVDCDCCRKSFANWNL